MDNEKLLKTPIDLFNESFDKDQVSVGKQDGECVCPDCKNKMKRKQGESDKPLKCSECGADMNENIFDKRALKIAIDTLKMSDVGASVSGGPDKPEAIDILKKKFGWNDAKISKELKKSGHTDQEIKKLLK